MNVAVGAASDIGQVREGNEDSYLVIAPLYAHRLGCSEMVPLLPPPPPKARANRVAIRASGK